MMCWLVPILVVYIYDVEYLVQYIISNDVYSFYYICGSIYFLQCRVCVCVCVCIYIYIFIYLLCECCSLFQCCVHVFGRLEVCCRKGKYGRLVNVEGWGALVSLVWGRVIFFVL